MTLCTFQTWDVKDIVGCLGIKASLSRDVVAEAGTQRRLNLERMTPLTPQPHLSSTLQLSLKQPPNPDREAIWPRKNCRRSIWQNELN